MSDETKMDKESSGEARRAFLGKAGRASLAAPAASLLLAASTRESLAVPYTTPPPPPPGRPGRPPRPPRNPRP
jgi:hypothetical protein